MLKKWLQTTAFINQSFLFLSSRNETSSSVFWIPRPSVIQDNIQICSAQTNQLYSGLNEISAVIMMSVSIDLDLKGF